jgi:hypothetical protein
VMWWLMRSERSSGSALNGSDRWIRSVFGRSLGSFEKSSAVGMVDDGVTIRSDRRRRSLLTTWLIFRNFAYLEYRMKSMDLEPFPKEPTDGRSYAAGHSCPSLGADGENIHQLPNPDTLQSQSCSSQRLVPNIRPVVTDEALKAQNLSGLRKPFQVWPLFNPKIRADFELDIRPDIERQLKENGQENSTIMLVRHGSSEETSKPTIVILTVLPATTRINVILPFQVRFLQLQNMHGEWIFVPVEDLF